MTVSRYVTVPNGILVAILAVVLVVGMPLMGDSGNVPVEASNPVDLIDAGSSGVDPIVSSPQAEPTKKTVEVITTVTETAPTNQELKLLKKVGPIEFPPYGAKVDERTIVVQMTEIKTEGFHIFVGANSYRDLSVSVVDINPEKHLVVLMLVRDSDGNIEKSLCKRDEETGSYYLIKRTSYKYGRYEEKHAATPQEYSQKEKELHSWEALVYVR